MMACPGLTKLSIIREGFGLSQLCMETRNGAFWSKLGTKEVSTGNWMIGGPSDAKGTPLKVELLTNGDSVNDVVSQTCHWELGIEGLT